MSSFSDPNFSVQNPAFVIQPNGFMYFMVSVQSSPQVTVSSLSVDQVTIISPTLPNGQLVLYDSINSRPPVTSAGQTFQYGGSSFALPSGANAGFSIGAVSNWNVALDSTSPVTVNAQITVSYQGGAKKKRSVTSFQSTPSGSTQTNSQTTVSLYSTTKSQSSTVYSCALIVVVCLLLLL